MSIATLKRKTKEKYNNASVGKSQFSINGTTRNQGWVGQTMISRSSSPYFLNDNNVIKPSVVSTYGMINTKYRWIRRPQPFSVVNKHTNTTMACSIPRYVITSM